MREHPEVEALVQLGFWWLFVAAAWGLAMLVLALAPARQQRAAVTVERHPWRSICCGVPLVMLPALLFAVLVEQHVRDGVQALLLFVTVSAAIGLSVSGRAVGHRLWPARSATLTTGCGTAILAITALFPPVGILVIVVASSIGIGAFVIPVAAVGEG